MTKRLCYLPLLLIILVSAAALPGQISELITNWPIIRLWNNPEAQMTRMLGDIPYQSLKQAAEQLSPDVTILLVTSGEDVRRREYTTYHRAMYLLAPRPIWWLSPAPSDGTWESRWWISRPLTAENIAQVASEKSADCLLLIDSPGLPNLGETVGQLPGVEIIQAGSKNCLANNPTNIINYPAPFWPVRLLLALLVIVSFGFAFLTLADRFGGRLSRLETLALAWLIGAGLLSTTMFWLDRLGLPLNSQLIILTVAAAILLLWQRRFVAKTLTPLRFNLAVLKLEGSRWQQTAVLLLVFFLLFQLLFVVLMAVGRPLTIWDSWVNWGSKGRMIFLENGVTPALYADPSRAVMLLGYPISIPLLEAWLYGWLGAADDRLVGILFVLTYLALAAFLFGHCRRRGMPSMSAFLMMSAAVTPGHIVDLTASAFTDLWLAVLLLVAAAFLLEWLENGQTLHLIIPVISAGLLTWIKQEGMVLTFILLLSIGLTFLLCRSRRGWKIGRLFLAVSLIGLAAVLFGGPWRLLAAREAVLVSVFLPLTAENLLANLDRIPIIIWLSAKELVNLRTGLVWPAAAIVLLARRSQWRQILGRPSVLLLLIPAFYLGIMTIPYLFSDFLPYQQHILSSIFRINAHVLLLPLLWIGTAANTSNITNSDEE